MTRRITKVIIIVTNVLVSAALVTIGMRGMVLRDPLLGTGYEWSTALWILGLMSFFLIPLEICVLKSEEED